MKKHGSTEATTPANGRLPPMPETPAATTADAHTNAPAEVRTIALSPIEVDALARMETSWRSACASIIASRSGTDAERWSFVRDEHGLVVGLEKTEAKP